jgi:hypothetical protein
MVTMTADKWLTYLNSIALFGLITALAFLNLDFSTLNTHLFKRAPTEIATFNLGDLYRQGCPEHVFSSVIHVSRAPDIMIIEGFLTEAEADFLVQLGYPPSPFNPRRCVGDVGMLMLCWCWC